MKIKEIKTQNRRDFKATYICEYCAFEMDKNGYDDRNFHENIIPKVKCPKCKKVAPSNYRPLATKYPEGMVV